MPGAVFGAPRIINDVSCARGLIDDIYFARQVQYLVKLESEHCK